MERHEDLPLTKAQFPQPLRLCAASLMVPMPVEPPILWRRLPVGAGCAAVPTPEVSLTPYGTHPTSESLDQNTKSGKEGVNLSALSLFMGFCLCLLDQVRKWCVLTN